MPNPADAARARTLLRRALGCLLVLYWLPVAAWAAGALVETLFFDVHPTLARPGFLGYPELFFKRLAALEGFRWFVDGGYACLAVLLGMCLVARRHAGPTWGEDP